MGDNIDKFVERHSENTKASIERIKTLCEESLEHDHSWNVFYRNCKEMLNHEDSIVRVLSDDHYEEDN